MKNMRVLIDTNIILDFVLKREPFFGDAKLLVRLCMQGKILGFVAVHSISNMFYILRNDFPVEERRNILLDFCKIFAVVGIDSEMVESALLNGQFVDFEDCLQVECAKSCEADYIVTRNVKDFAASSVLAVEPAVINKMFSVI